MEIRSQTVRAIASLLSLFTDEEKEGLKITLGTTSLTLEDQFIARWHDAKPRYLGNLFLYKAAHIVNGNKALFTRVIEFNRPEFQEKLKKMLSDPETYIKIKETKIDNKDKSKNLSISRGNSSGLSQATNKTRSGLSESGEEYMQLDKIWELEDKKMLNKRLEAEPIGIALKVDPEKKGAEGISLGAEASPADPAPNSGGLLVFDSPGFSPHQDRDSGADVVENPDIVLQSINLSQGRNLSLDQQTANKLLVDDRFKELDGKTTTKDMVTIEALQMMTATKIKDPRETAFQKLDVLFSQCQ